MTTTADIELLTTPEVRDAIERNIERDPAAIALDRSVPHASAVATAVKYLQRSRRKLPRLYAVRAIIPPRAFEQSSSEESAERKPIAGDSLLELTCGLGIDAIAFASRFRRVVTLERDEQLARIVRHNLKLLGISNVEVVTTSAEEYVESCNEHFDWVYADPDRRSSDGRKMVCMEDCSPNILQLMPRLREIASRVAIKLSPLFDCDEAFRLLAPAEVEIVSIGGECKEVNIYTQATKNTLRIAPIGMGEWSFSDEDMNCAPNGESFAHDEYRYLLVPDVALQKGRVAIAALKPYASIWSNNGYAFAHELPTEKLPCRIYEIESIAPYRPKELKRRWKGCGVEIMKRDCQLSIEAVRKAIGAKAGSEATLAITTIGSDNWVITLK